MKLQTLIPVTYSHGAASQSSGVITMILGSVSYQNNFQSIGINFMYVKEDESVLVSDAFYINGTDKINSFFDLLKPNLPPFLNEVQYTQAKFMEGAKYEMARTFNIGIDKIIILDEDVSKKLA
jgi:hypothetical protein